MVDDASGDSTLDFLHEVERQYVGWVKVISLTQNLGAASARNAGWDKALGNFVAFLDADDSWHPRKIEVQYQFMAARPDVVVSGHGHVQVDAVPVPVPVPLDVLAFYPISERYVLLKNPFITPSFMVRRDLSFRFLAGRRYMEDHYFLMQVSVAGLGIAKTNLPLAFIYKNIFGAAGLSADLWGMQRSELENYALLRHEGRISLIAVLFLKGYSWLKFFRRVAMVTFRKQFYG